MTKSPEMILRFIVRNGGVVDEYPIIEFFGAESQLHDLETTGMVRRIKSDNGWDLFQITDRGVERLGEWERQEATATEERRGGPA